MVLYEEEMFNTHVKNFEQGLKESDDWAGG
jgi:hypothetical protein